MTALPTAARFCGALALAAAGCLTISCGGIQSPSNNVVDQASGTLNPQGGMSHFFSVSKTGEYTVKLTALAPTSNALIGLALVAGNNDSTCSSSVYQQNNFSSLNMQALGGQILSGRYCVLVYDVGTITIPQTYTIAVSHP